MAVKRGSTPYHLSQPISHDESFERFRNGSNKWRYLETKSSSSIDRLVRHRGPISKRRKKTLLISSAWTHRQTQPWEQETSNSERLSPKIHRCSGIATRKSGRQVSRGAHTAANGRAHGGTSKKGKRAGRPRGKQDSPETAQNARQWRIFSPRYWIAHALRHSAQCAMPSHDNRRARDEDRTEGPSFFSFFLIHILRGLQDHP
ncbi:uncharacterized protein K489DRAFT_134543 [Dissoconium aciculare CBS 342.82]|uniref:Uncharacterized protein n=1 Tax=Dissoconium aciculare CBS 342.82 TaxID=1314786 RepID=A0A6J3LRW1_9PEZI|nr:uncharacterized protein K489DRAFT_134543 [Dissoconium aciculare CBS 342.82]KAF1818019.1 hypothetical protein K489DRAFT_134543 [Dissoconium aciculare CBS 342.82]